MYICLTVLFYKLFHISYVFLEWPPLYDCCRRTLTTPCNRRFCFPSNHEKSILLNFKLNLHLTIWPYAKYLYVYKPAHSNRPMYILDGFLVLGCMRATFIIQNIFTLLRQHKNVTLATADVPPLLLSLFRALIDFVVGVAVVECKSCSKFSCAHILTYRTCVCLNCIWVKWGAFMQNSFLQFRCYWVTADNTAAVGHKNKNNMKWNTNIWTAHRRHKQTASQSYNSLMWAFCCSCWWCCCFSCHNNKYKCGYNGKIWNAHNNSTNNDNCTKITMQ